MFESFQTGDCHEEKYGAQTRSKTKDIQKHRKGNLMKCFFRKYLTKKTQHLIVLIIGCGHKSKRNIIFSAKQDGLYDIPNVYLDCKLYFYQESFEKEDAFREDDSNTRREKDLSATRELLNFLQSNPTIWKRINSPDGGLRLV